MPNHKHPKRAVQITYGTGGMNGLNLECGLATECTQKFQSKTERPHYIFRIQ